MNEITIRNARENNLRSLSCSIPREQLVVVTGPSGSGKTSLVLDTIYKESVRRYSAAGDPQQLGRLHRFYKPKVDEISGLSFARAIDRSVNNPLATIATLTRCYDFLKALFYYFGTPVCDSCGALLTVAKRSEIIAQLNALPDQTELTIRAPLGSFNQVAAAMQLEQIAANGFTRVYLNEVLCSVETALDSIAESDSLLTLEIAVDRFKLSGQTESRLNEALNLASRAANGKVAVAVAATGAESLLSFCELPFCSTCKKTAAVPVSDDFSYFHSTRGGSENPAGDELSYAAQMLPLAARSSQLGSLSFGAALSLPQSTVLDWLQNLSASSAVFSEKLFESAKAGLQNVLEFSLQLGLGYLALGRQAATLSAGELQRAKLVRSISRQTRGVLYCLDEPTIGLHPDDVQHLLLVMRSLIQNGNSVVAIEHHPQFLDQADYLLEIGPGAGKCGGTLLVSGKRGEVRDSIQSAKLAGVEASAAASTETTKFTDFLQLRGSSRHNLKELDIDLPLGALVCVTGVSGSGKSSLVSDTLLPALEQFLAKSKKSQNAPVLPEAIAATLHFTSLDGWQKLKGAVDITQLSLGANRRSTVATVADVLEPLRTLYAMIPEAQVEAFTAAHFSFNTKQGACKVCGGEGSAPIGGEEYFSLRVPCSECKGTRFNQSVLSVLWKGKSIADVLSASVEENLEFFAPIPSVAKPLEQLREVGLSYLSLSQETDSLSTGELQRLKIVGRVGKRATEGTLFAFDEPTRGLARAEVAALLKLFRQLLKKGASIVATEHNVDFISNSDYVIDLGPGAGSEGGKLVASGAPEAIKNSESKLAKYL